MFGRVLEHLHNRGLDHDTARLELLRLMRGDSSEELESLGIHLKARSYPRKDD